MRFGTACTALAIIACFAIFPAQSGLAAEGFEDRMEDMDWYDSPRDDYKEYTAEEIRKYIPEDEEAPDLQMPRGAPPGIPASSQRIILYLFLGVLVFFCGYLAWRWFRERDLTPTYAGRTLGGKAPEVLELPGLDLDVATETDLKAAVRAALAGRRMREAAAYTFAFFLLELAERELLELRRDRTAREYLRTVQRDERIEPALRELFSRAAVNFETAVYGERAPEADLAGLWRDLTAALGIPDQAVSI